MIDFFSEPEPSDLILQKRCPINFFQNFSGKPSRTHSCLDYTQGFVHGCRTVLRTSLARSISLNVPFRTATLERKYNASYVQHFYDRIVDQSKSGYLILLS